MTNLYTKTTFKIKPRSLLTCSFLCFLFPFFLFSFFFFFLYLLLHCFFFLLSNVCRVPGNSAAVTALQEELNNRGIENVCLEEEVMGRSFHPYKFLRVEQLFTCETTKKKKIDIQCRCNSSQNYNSWDKNQEQKLKVRV